MANPVYMRATGQTQGEIKGGSTVLSLEREDTIEIIQIDHQVHIPTDLLSGKVSGARQHKPFQVRATIDKATPLMYQALCQGETFSEVQFRFFRTSLAGMEEHYFTIVLRNARLGDVVLDVPNVKNPKLAIFPDMVTYSFMYQRIEWTYEEGGFATEDDWQSR